MSKPTDLVQGTLDLLLLRVLSLEPMHGWAIAQRIRQMSNEQLRVGESALYPALHKLEQQGWIEAEWAPSENNRRAKYYKHRGWSQGVEGRNRGVGTAVVRDLVDRQTCLRRRRSCAGPESFAFAFVRCFGVAALNRSSPNAIQKAVDRRKPSPAIANDSPLVASMPM